MEKIESLREFSDYVDDVLSDFQTFVEESLHYEPDLPEFSDSQLESFLLRFIDEMCINGSYFCSRWEAEQNIGCALFDDTFTQWLIDYGYFDNISMQSTEYICDKILDPEHADLLIRQCAWDIHLMSQHDKARAIIAKVCGQAEDEDCSDPRDVCAFD